MILAVLSLILLLACAPKVKVDKTCPSGEEILSSQLSKHVPENYRVYGTIKYGPLRFPLMLAKFDGFYTVKVARAKDVLVDSNRLCVEGKCYLLPASPESLIFGKVLSGKESYYCRRGELLFRDKVGVYEKTAVFEGKRLKELVFRNTNSGKHLRISFSGDASRGFFEGIIFDLDGRKVKLHIEEVEF